MKVLEHLTEEAIQHYRAKNLSVTELLAAQRHVGGCAECRARLERAVAVDAAVSSLHSQLAFDSSAPENELNHLPYEQLSLYVDAKLDDVEREIADSHLAICQSCADDLADLRRYQAIAAAAEIQPALAPAATTASEEVTTVPPSVVLPDRRSPFLGKAGAWLQRLFAFDYFPSLGAFVPAGMAAAVVAVLLVGVWLATRTKPQNSGGELAKIAPTQPAPSPVASDTQSNKSVSTENINSSNVRADESPVLTSAPRSPRPQPLAAKPPRPSANSSSAPTRTLNDGGEQIAFDAEGNVSGLESVSASVRQAVRRSISAQRAQTPGTLDVIADGGTGILMSGSAEVTNNGVPFALVTPVARVVRESQPTLRWRPLAGAKSYTVAIVDASFHIIAQSPRLTATEWTLDRALPRGANYAWQVTAMLADGTEVVSPVSPAPQAKFRVMEQSAFDEVMRMEQGGVKSHLARGVIYAEAGLLDNARAEFEALVRDNPRSQLARKLLYSVKK